MKIIFLDDFEISIYKSHLAKKITISIRPAGLVRVTIPKYVSYLEAERFARQKKEWIISNLQTIRERSNQVVLPQNYSYLTKNHKLVLTPQKKSGVYVRVQNGIISVKYDSTINENSIEIKKSINKGVQVALKKEATEYLPKRLEELSKDFNIIYFGVSIKSMKTRWGSCTGRNKINLNSHLMTLPNHLIDYVLLHELAHVKVKNHSKSFWNLLESICPNSKKYDKELKSFKILGI